MDSVRSILARAKARIGTPERFMAKVCLGYGGACWAWIGCISHHGYGRFRDSDGATRDAHRVAFTMLRGPVRDGLQVDHLCRNRACVNPDHMEIVTSRENTIRGGSPPALRLRSAVCPNGHSYAQHGGPGWRRCQVCLEAKARRKYMAVHSDPARHAALLARQSRYRQRRAIASLPEDAS